MPRLQDKYKKEVIPALRKEFGIANVMAVPRIVKVTVNTGVGVISGRADDVDENGLLILTLPLSRIYPAQQVRSARSRRLNSVPHKRASIRGVHLLRS